MHTLLSFGDHTFEDRNQIDFQDNFSTTVANSHSLPGRDGGLMSYGDAKSPTPLGNVQMSLWVHAGSRGIQSQLDDLRRLPQIGLQTLTMLPSGLIGESPRTCRALAREITMPQTVVDMSQNIQRVQISFDVPFPYWHGVMRTRTINAIGTSTAFNIENGGNARTVPILRLTTNNLQTAGRPQVVRLIGTTISDSVRYHSDLPPMSNLYIDCASKQITLNGADAYGTAFSALTGDWIPLLPGQNSMEVRMLNAGDAGTLTVTWQDRWV